MTQRHSGVEKVMWEMQQLRGRADAVDVDLKSHRLDEMALLSSSAASWMRGMQQCSRAAPHKLT